MLLGGEREAKGSCWGFGGGNEGGERGQSASAKVGRRGGAVIGSKEPL